MNELKQLISDLLVEYDEVSMEHRATMPLDYDFRKKWLLPLAEKINNLDMKIEVIKISSKIIHESNALDAYDDEED
ncbi:hypothetical protein [Haploplasma axanthum]|uniref:Uncharacterized protein n=1 Tax=Haploplasma axanthum TaxID=29552 RepID=A0A449BG22_HAPAX|nr:hypothetical protein [Haploplasma axanthum]VEU79548.1 Uncharacterised protein [Haploplasma axanthum]VEU81341.1 Uncharacterised protein [Haploplasma axanthum]VEU81360.1 Uncharacterised protein [Haploplasma axanthum]VEU81377.1 Uncharacterised protein [Haploplasma axanthum]